MTRQSTRATFDVTPTHTSLADMHRHSMHCNSRQSASTPSHVSNSSPAYQRLTSRPKMSDIVQFIMTYSRLRMLPSRVR